MKRCRRWAVVWRTENGERRTENGERSARQARDGRSGGRTVEGLPCGADTKNHKEPRRFTKKVGKEEPQIPEKHRGAQRGQRDTEAGGVLAHAGRRMEAWKFGGLEGWRSPRGLGPSCRLRRQSGRNPKTARVGTAEWEPQIPQILSRLRAC